MSRQIARTWIVFLGLSVAGPLSATTVTLNVDFESPTFAAGPIGGVPPFTAGQGGWGGFNAGAITNTRAHSGTQSLASGPGSNGGSAKALDPATQGEYPASSAGFPISGDWWAQAWVLVTPGGAGAAMSIISGLSLSISGTGTPYVETSIPGYPPDALANQGANVLDQWILLRMAHNVGMGQYMEFSILGDNVNLTYSRFYANNPSFAQYLVLSGDAYWDDVGAGFGAPPAVVPIPAAGWLFVSGLGPLMAHRRALAIRQLRNN